MDLFLYLNSEKYKNDSLSLLNEIGTKKFMKLLISLILNLYLKSFTRFFKNKKNMEVYQSTGKKYSYWINKRIRIFS